MAQFHLANQLRVGPYLLSVGRLVDDAVDDVPLLQAAGAVLFPVGTASVDAVADRITRERARRGISEAEAEALMLSTIAVANA